MYQIKFLINYKNNPEAFEKEINRFLKISRKPIEDIARELGEYLDVKSDTIRKWARSGIIPKIKLTNKCVRFNLHDVIIKLKLHNIQAGRLPFYWELPEKELENNHVLGTHDIPQGYLEESGEASAATGLGQLAGMKLGDVERECIRLTLMLNNGNREKTARMLGIGKRTLYRKIKEYGLR